MRQINPGGFIRDAMKEVKTFFSTPLHKKLILKITITIVLTFLLLFTLGYEHGSEPTQSPPMVSTSVIPDTTVLEQKVDPMIEKINNLIDTVRSFDYKNYLGSKERLIKGVIKLNSYKDKLGRYEKNGTSVVGFKYLPELRKSVKEKRDTSFLHFRAEYQHLVPDILNLPENKKIPGKYRASISRESFEQDVMRVYHKKFKSPGLREDAFELLEAELMLFEFKSVAFYEYRRKYKSIRVELRKVSKL